MSQNSTLDNVRTEPSDNLDRLLTDYFKAQLKHPWPGAPSMATNEPSSLYAVRNATEATPRNQPAAATRDSSGKSRFTLAASVALLLGTCWYFSNGFQPGERNLTTTPNGAGMLPDAGASNPEPLEHLKKTNATGENDKTNGRSPMKLP